jgi:hypothetical protein
VPGNDKSMNRNGNMGTLVKKNENNGNICFLIFKWEYQWLIMVNHGPYGYIYINMHTDKQLKA